MYAESDVPADSLQSLLFCARIRTSLNYKIFTRNTNAVVGQCLHEWHTLLTLDAQIMQKREH